MAHATSLSEALTPDVVTQIADRIHADALIEQATPGVEVPTSFRLWAAAVVADRRARGLKLYPIRYVAPVTVTR